MFCTQMQSPMLPRGAVAALTLALLACGGDAPEAGMEEMEGAEVMESETMGEMEDGMDEMGGMEMDAALLNPNLATADELRALPGMTDDVVNAVIAGRPWLRVSDMNAALSGAIGEGAAMAAYEALWLPINLNDVTNAEILLIPGVGDRMAYEFEEYRPYENMAEFRREIGKYVDEAELERLARYVFVPIDPNMATNDEIMTIPGMTDRIAFEFQEHRPFGDLEQFRSEIGNYVDETEVARLERYITLN